jgi:hypothetical protein
MSSGWAVRHITCAEQVIRCTGNCNNKICVIRPMEQSGDFAVKPLSPEAN